MDNFALIVFTFAALVASEDLETCKTPLGEQGICIILTQCTELFAILKAPDVSNEKLQMLKRSECGFGSKQNKVCCPLKGYTNEYPFHDIGVPDALKSHPNRHLLPGSASCGRSKKYPPVASIFGGKEVEVGKYPWMALLGMSNDKADDFQWGCGGALINDKYVLTAAHCFFNTDNLATKFVRLGEHRISTWRDCFRGYCAPPVVDVEVEELIPHPQYNLPRRRHDIALIRLQQPVRIREYIYPTCLPFGDLSTVSIDQLVKEVQWPAVAGWGLTENYTQSDVLMEVYVPLINQSECKRRYATPTLELGGTQFCAGGVALKDACTGDSGGPIMLSQLLPFGHQHVTMGVISFGPPICGIENYPAVYTKVADYLEWILDTIQP